MYVRSQENNMRRLALLLSQDLGYIHGERDSGPNGAKKTFINLGKTFLRALAKDLGLRDVRVLSNAGGIAVSGECMLYGMWQTCGLFVCLSQPECGGDGVFMYRTIRGLDDHKGGHNHYIRLSELRTMSYETLLARLSAPRREERFYERAA